MVAGQEVAVGHVGFVVFQLLAEFIGDAVALEQLFDQREGFGAQRRNDRLLGLTDWN